MIIRANLAIFLISRHLKKINQNELLNKYIGKINEPFIRKAMEFHFSFAAPGDKTYKVMISYLFRMLLLVVNLNSMMLEIY